MCYYDIASSAIKKRLREPWAWQSYVFVFPRPYWGGGGKVDIPLRGNAMSEVRNHGNQSENRIGEFTRWLPVVKLAPKAYLWRAPCGGTGWLGQSRGGQREPPYAARNSHYGHVGWLEEEGQRTVRLKRKTGVHVPSGTGCRVSVLLGGTRPVRVTAVQTPGLIRPQVVRH